MNPTDGAQALPPVPGPKAQAAKEYYRRNLPHYQPADSTVFVTFATRGRWVIPERLRSVVLQHCLHDHTVKAWFHGVVVMPDHVHLVFTPLADASDQPYGLGEIMRGIKGASARSINKALGRTGPVWEAESYDRVLRKDENIRTVVEYVCRNPVEEGLATSEDDYRWLWREWIEGSESIGSGSSITRSSPSIR